VEEISGIVQAEQKLRHRRLRFAIGLPDQNKNAFSGSRQLTQTIQKATKREESPQTREQAKEKRTAQKKQTRGQYKKRPKKEKKKEETEDQKKKKKEYEEREMVGREQQLAFLASCLHIFDLEERKYYQIYPPAPTTARRK